MKTIFSPLSLRRLEEIHRYIARDNPTAAGQVISRIRQVVELLGEFPEIGPVWDDGPSRAMRVSGLPYRIHYRLNRDADTLEIVTVVHTSQRWP